MARLFPRAARNPRGFTLIESAMVTTIIGVGVVAVLQLLAAGTMANGDGAELTTGLTLARNVREMMLGLSFADPSFSNQWHPGSPPHWGPESGESSLAARDDLDDFNGVSISPPIDARRTSLTHYAGWTQQITVRSVDPDLLTSPVPNGTSPAIRVTVAVSHNSRKICELSWTTFCTK